MTLLWCCLFDMCRFFHSPLWAGSEEQLLVWIRQDCNCVWFILMMYFFVHSKVERKVMTFEMYPNFWSMFWKTLLYRRCIRCHVNCYCFLLCVSWTRLLIKSSKKQKSSCFLYIYNDLNRLLNYVTIRLAVYQVSVPRHQPIVQRFVVASLYPI